MGKQGAKQQGLSKPRKEAVFVEIGHDWIKLVQAEVVKNGVVLSRVHLAPMDAEVNIADAIAAAIKQKKFSSPPVLACLPRQTVNLRFLELPSTDSAEIADMVDLQIGRQTPYSRDEILSDYRELGRTRQGTYTRIMLAIVQRSVVRERFYEIEGAGLDIERMGVSSEGLLNWFLYRMRDKETEKAMAVVDVDSFYTQLLVVHHGRAVFSKSILVGAKQLQGSYDEAVEKLTQELRGALQACRGELRDSEIESCTLSGAGVHVDGLAEALGEALSLPCEAADCLSDVQLGKGAADLGDARYATVSLTALVGMALDPGNLKLKLVPDVVRMRKRLMDGARLTGRFATLVMVAMVSASLYAVLASAFKANRLEKLQSVANATQPDVVRVERMIEVIRAANARQDSRFAPINLLPAIHACVPEDVYFELVDIDTDARRVALGGTAAARKDIRDLIKLLEDSPLFVNVAEDGRVTMDQEKRFNFRIVAAFEERE